MSFKRLYAIYKSIRLRDKIFINYLLLCIIPLTIVTAMSYYFSVSQTRETMTAFINLFATELNAEIENYVSSIDNTSKIIINDENILRFLSHENQYLLSERVTNRNAIYGYLNNMALQKPDVQNILIVGSSKNIYFSGISEHQLENSQIERESWFQDIQSSGGNLIITPLATPLISGKGSSKALFVIGRALKDVHGTLHGTIAFIVDQKNMIKANPNRDKTISEYDIGIEILNANNEHIYNVPSRSLSMLSENLENQAMIITSHSSKYGLTISVYVPKGKLFQQIDFFKNIAFSFVIVMVCLTILLSFLLSHTITKPLSMLANSMILFRKKQQYDYIPTAERHDEIGVLAENYNQMIAKINSLINDVYLAKIKEKQSQFYALQNQINPHMFYNTIENIRMRAVLNDDPEVSDMIKNFGKIFRLTLSSGKANHTLADEIEYTKAYLDLLNIRRDKHYTLLVDIPDTLLKADIIRFAFQPIVENSIVHGFDDAAVECMIHIDAVLVQNDIRIRISDNGMGIQTGKLANIKKMLIDESDNVVDERENIGLQNVYDRIKLHYEGHYYLDIDSRYGEGTTVELLIPFTARRST